MTRVDPMYEPGQPPNEPRYAEPTPEEVVKACKQVLLGCVRLPMPWNENWAVADETAAEILRESIEHIDLDGEDYCHLRGQVSDAMANTLVEDWPV